MYDVEVKVGGGALLEDGTYDVEVKVGGGSVRQFCV